MDLSTLCVISGYNLWLPFLGCRLGPQLSEISCLSLKVSPTVNWSGWTVWPCCHECFWLQVPNTAQEEVLLENLPFPLLRVLSELSCSTQRNFWHIESVYMPGKVDSVHASDEEVNVRTRSRSVSFPRSNLFFNQFLPHASLWFLSKTDSTRNDFFLLNMKEFLVVPFICKHFHGRHHVCG